MFQPPARTVFIGGVPVVLTGDFAALCELESIAKTSVFDFLSNLGATSAYTSLAQMLWAFSTTSRGGVGTFREFASKLPTSAKEFTKLNTVAQSLLLEALDGGSKNDDAPDTQEPAAASQSR